MDVQRERSSPSDLHIVYRMSDLKGTEDHKCGFNEEEHGVDVDVLPLLS